MREEERAAALVIPPCEGSFPGNEQFATSDTEKRYWVFFVPIGQPSDPITVARWRKTDTITP
jgi:hypothetical protein